MLMFRYFVILILIYSCNILYANAGEDEFEIITLEPTIVESKSIQDNGTYSIQRISRKEIESYGASSLVEVLKSQPNITINTMGSYGNTASIRLNGAKSAHVVILLDGVKVSDPSNIDSFFDIGQIPLFLIEEIEIIRGNAGVLYGSGALSGVINIKTRDFTSNTLAVSQELGSYYSMQSDAALGLAYNQLSLMMTVNYFSTAGYSLANSINNNPTENDGGQVQSINFKAKYKFNKQDFVELFFRNGSLKTDYDNFNFETQQIIDEDTLYNTKNEDVGYLRFNFNLFTIFNSEILVSMFNTERESIEHDYASFSYTGQNMEYQYKGDITYSFINLGFGINVIDQKKLEGGYNDSLLDTAYFITLEESITPSFTTEQGYRYNIRDDNGYKRSFQNAYNLGFNYSPNKYFSTKFNYGSSFRLPSIIEIHSLMFDDNYLNPEYSQGVNLSFISNNFSSHINNLMINFFYLDIDNLLYFENLGEDDSRYVNKGSYNTYGFDVSVPVQIDSLTFTSSYTLTISTDRIEKRSSSLLPKHKISFNVEKRINNLSLSLQTLFISKTMDYTSPAQQSLKGYTLFNSTIMLNFSNQSKFYIRMENLTNTKYQNQYGYNTKGLSAYGGIQYIFGN